MSETVSSLAHAQIAEELVQRDLFGGYCEAVFPKRFIDVRYDRRPSVFFAAWGVGGSHTRCRGEWWTCYSDFRQVPDNQEVYTDAETDQSIIVEFVEQQDDVPPGDLAQYVLPLLWWCSLRKRFHFQELADVGGAAASEINRVGVFMDSEVPNLPPGEVKVFCVGHQKVSGAGLTAGVVWCGVCR